MKSNWTAFRMICAALLATSFAAAAVSAQSEPEMSQAIKTALESDPNNPILLMQHQMLTYKANPIVGLSRINQWSWQQRRSNLSYLVGQSGRAGNTNSGQRALQLYSGETAMRESLQLGTIGRQTEANSTPSIGIETISSLEVPSHPWQEMLGDNVVAVPELAKWAPKDMLFVHVQQPQQFLELEQILVEQVELFGDIYRVSELLDIKEKMQQRLRIPNADQLLNGVESLGFVSDDLSFRPRTDFAVIVKPKTQLLGEWFDRANKNRAHYKKIGDYLVIATNDETLARIERTQSEPSTALASTLDYQFMLSQMDERRDGLAYFSEDFIRKLTSPSYRINARRRNTILGALETLQYTTFAYRGITGEWPSSIKEIEEAGYIVPNSVWQPEQYRIDAQGKVHHAVWGSLWDVTPVNQVPINKVTQAEKSQYDQFNRRYNRAFNEFFDPIAVAYGVSDHLYVHTLILPLIEHRRYRDLQNIIGEEKHAFAFLHNPDRFGAANLLMNFDLDHYLLNDRNFGFNRRGMDTEFETEAQRQKALYEIESELSESLLDQPLVPGERLLDFLGDELIFGMGKQNSLSFNNIADLDVWFGIRLNDTEKAKTFFRALWARFASEFSGRGMGFLQLSTSEPLSNEYNGETFYIIPTGFVNIFYAFFDDAFYVTVSQVAMNRLIDARQTPDHEESKVSESVLRALAFVGDDHHVLGTLDLNDVTSYKLVDSERQFNRELKRQLTDSYYRWSEALTLARILPGYEGELGATDAYYLDLPDRFFNSKITIKNDTVYANTAQQQSIRLDELVSPDVYSSSSTQIERISTLYPVDEIKQRIKAFRAAALGMSFSPDGLEVKLALGNPKRIDPDAAFGFEQKDVSKPGTAKPLWPWGLAAFIVLLLIGLVWQLTRRESSDRGKAL